MKPFTALLILVFISHLSFSQKLVKANKKWEGTKFEYPQTNFQSKFRSETHYINDQVYYELMYKVKEGWFEGVQQYYRQENDKVFRLYEGEEKLIYDFSLTVGDTIQLSDDDGKKYAFFPVRTADTTIFNKTLRKLEMKVIPENSSTVSSAKHVWIEGVGDIAFFFGYGEVFNNQKASLIHCVKESSFFYSAGTQCPELISSTEFINEVENYFAYNNVTKYLEILNEDVDIVQIYKLSGQLIKSFSISQKNEILDLSSMDQTLIVVVAIGEYGHVSKIISL